jgi:hypothetical protein
MSSLSLDQPEPGAGICPLDRAGRCADRRQSPFVCRALAALMPVVRAAVISSSSSALEGGAEPRSSG